MKKDRNLKGAAVSFQSLWILQTCSISGSLPQNVRLTCIWPQTIFHWEHCAVQGRGEQGCPSPLGSCTADTSAASARSWTHGFSDLIIKENNFISAARHREPGLVLNLRLPGYKSCPLTTWPRDLGAWVLWQQLSHLHSLFSGPESLYEMLLFHDGGGEKNSM